jgi:putative membrane protein
LFQPDASAEGRGDANRTASIGADNVAFVRVCCGVWLSLTGLKELLYKEDGRKRRQTGMANPSTDKVSSRFEVRATADSHFSWLRTRLGVERTLMSWVRTAVALIGFGFTIVLFFNRMNGMPGVAPARLPDAPRYLGLMLILCGILALVLSVWEYQWTLGYLWGGNFELIAGVTKEGKQTPLFAVAIALILVGVFAFFSVLLRLV